MVKTSPSNAGGADSISGQGAKTPYVSWPKNQTDTSTPAFTAALLTIARTCKQPKCPSTEEWIKTTWYTCTMEYHSVVKRNKTVPFAEMRMDLETVIQKEKKNHILYVESRNMILMNIFLQSGNRDKCMERTNVWLPKEERVGGMNWKIGTDIYPLLYINQTTNENLLYSTRNYIKCRDLNGKDIQKRGDVYTHTDDLLCYTAETNTTL